MGGKKGKKGKKSKKGKEEPEPEDHYMTMKGEQLEITIENLKEKLTDAKIKRNMLQIERDMIHDFYHNTREEIKELDAKVLNFDTQMQKAEEDHRSSISSHMQKVKHLEYEHVNQCDTVKEDAITDMRGERTTHTETEKANLGAKGEKKDMYSRDEMANIAEVQEKEKHCQEIIKDLVIQLEFTKKNLIESNQRKLQRLEEELTLRMKVEIHEIEERKNEHINQLMTNHEQAFREMKEYYNDITRENLELIKVHQEKHAEIREKINQNGQLVQEMKSEHEKLQPKYQAVLQDLRTFQKQVSTFDKDTMALRNANGCLKDLRAKTKTIKENHEALVAQFRQVDKEKNEMYAKFEEAVAGLRQKADHKNVVLERKLMVMGGDLEKKEHTLRELVQRSGLDQGTVDEICKKMEEAMEAKSSILKNLEYSLAHATKAYNDAIRVYEAKLVEFGIPAEELGLEPLVTKTSTMPAGLVAA